MLCRVLLAAVGISYLVCVLFLSGIQREDLDVSLLKKMRHYDIDYDKNNEQLRTECLNDTGKKNSKDNNDQNTTEKKETTPTKTSIKANNAVNLDTSELKSVLKYLKHKKKIRNPPTTEPYKWKNSVETVEIKHLIENLMSENDNNIKENQGPVTWNHLKQSSFEDMNKQLPSYTRKLDASEPETKLANTPNATENNTAIDIHKKKNNSTKETITKDFDINNLKDKIGQFFSEYLSNRITLPITTKPESEKKVTEMPQISPHEIEEKFASSLAAINELNENIAILQKNIKGAKFLNQSVSNKSKDSEANFDKTTKKYAKEVEVDKLQSVSKSTSDYPMIKTENTQNVPKLNSINKNYDNSMSNDPKTMDVIQTNVDPLKSSPLEFSPRGNSSPDTVYAGYDKERNIESPILKHAKNNQLKYNPNSQGMVVSEYDYDRQKLANIFINDKNYAAYPTKNSQYEFIQKDNMKEITNYNYDKQRIPDNTNTAKSQKIYPEDQLPFQSNSQNIQDMINYGYYNQRQPENRMQHFQYNDEGLGNGLLQERGPDIVPPYNTDKMIEDLNVPVHQNNGDIFKNNQMQFPPAPHHVQETTNGGYDKQDELDSRGMDVSKNKNLPLPFQIQNGKDSLYPEFDIPKELESHIPKPQENFKEFPLPFQIENGKDTFNSGFDIQTELDSRIPKPQENFQLSPIKTQNEKDTLSSEFNIQNGITSHVLKPQENLNSQKANVNKSNDTQRDQINSFSMDMISKIAESVKEIVLKDLKKEMASTMSTTAIPLTTSTAKTTESSISTTVPTSSTTTVATTSSPTTTTSTTTTPTTTSSTTPTTTSSTTPTTTSTTTPTTTAFTTAPTMPTCTTTPSPIPSFTVTPITDLKNKSQKINDSKIQDATQAIQKFIELFEQMKSEQDKTIKHNEKKYLPKLGMTKYNMPIVMFPQPLPPMSPFGMRVPSKQMPIIVHNFIPPALNGPPFPPNYMSTMDTSNSMSRIHQPPHYEPQHFPNAVMIQTNKNEIQPLGVPMVKPEAINLNIVMTTQNPFWSRQERDRWNYMYKYGRSPDKQNDIKNVKNSFNVYSNIPDSKSLNSNKDLNKEAVLALNKSNSLLNAKIRLNILKQFDFYNKPDNADKNAIEEIRKRILSQVNQQNKFDTSKYQPFITNNFNPNNYIDDSNIKAYINQMGKRNENVFNMPYNARVDTNPLYDAYKDIDINPNNLLYGQLQNRGLINEMNPYAYKQPQLNYLDQGKVINAGPIRPTNFQNDNIRFVAKENILDGANEVYHPNTASGTFSPIPNAMDIAREEFRSHYLKPTSDTQIQNVNVMPMKDINSYSGQSKPYRSERVNNLKIMPNNGEKYTGHSRLTLVDRMPKIESSEYQYSKPISRFEDRQPNEAKDLFKNNINKYYDSPSRTEPMKMKENPFVTKQRNYARPIFRNPENSNDVSGTMDKIKMKFENPRYSSSPSDEDLNREFVKGNLIRPYHGVNTRTSIINSIKINKQRDNDYSGFENKKPSSATQPQQDLINAVFGHLDKQKTSKEQDQSFDSERHNHENKKYRQHSESSDSKVNMKVRRPDSASDYKYSGRVRGFHDKLESTGSWPESPSDCGSDERCLSSVKILSRHQQPLDGKKNGKYDDSRFKSFLKTQQKVNHMLEMILANKADEFHSVEHV